MGARQLILTDMRKSQNHAKNRHPHPSRPAPRAAGTRPQHPDNPDTGRTACAVVRSIAHLGCAAMTVSGFS